MSAAADPILSRFWSSGLKREPCITCVYVCMCVYGGIKKVQCMYVCMCVCMFPHFEPFLVVGVEQGTLYHLYVCVYVCLVE